MREIKFRAWDKQERKMVYGVEGAYDGATGGEKTPDVRYADCFSVYLGQKAPHNREPDAYMNWGEDNQELRYEVMQYTGLKDKNGKEIYESDILRIYFSDGLVSDGVIIWNNEGAKFEWRDGDGFWSLTQTNNFAVIGNIHENSELLEK